MATATWIQQELEQSGVSFQELHHEEVFTAQAVAEREHMSGHHVAKVVVIIADGRPIELILPATRRVALGVVRDLIGAKEVRLASESELRQYFAECEVGAIPALRHWKDVDILMDSSLRVEGDILFQAGTHCDAVRMGFDDWFRMVNPRVERFTEPVRDAQRGAFEDWGTNYGEI